MIENWRDNQEIRLFRDSLRKFLEKEAIPYFNEWEEQRMIPREFWLKADYLRRLNRNHETDYSKEYGTFVGNDVCMDDSSDICCIS